MALTGKNLVFWIGGRLREVVAHGGLTVIRIFIFGRWFSSGKEETTATPGNENNNSHVDFYLLSSGLLREYLAGAFARNVARIPSPLFEAASRDFGNQSHHLAEMV